MMKKQVYKIDSNGFLIGIHLAEFDEDGNLIGELAENVILLDLPEGLYSPKWTGSEWVEDMPQSEIDELNKPTDYPPTDTEILGQQMTEREFESMLQGQQITDIDLRLFEMEVANNV